MALTQSAADLWGELKSGALSSVELTRACLDEIERSDEQIGAFLRVSGEQALAAAAEIDARRASGRQVGLLAGLPVAVKDVLCQAGEVVTCGSRMLADFRSPYDATVIARLKAADAVLIGRTNMDEFAMGGSTENSAFQITRNPWDLARVPGGSSGGSAASVAAGMAPLAIGTDTGGSIRQPAAFCGVTGLKPTYGRVSRFGLVAFASSLDQVGPMGSTAEDTALLLSAIAGHDPQDSTSAPRGLPRYIDSVTQTVAKLVIGIAKEHFTSSLDPEVERAVRSAAETFRSLGAEIREISLPHGKYGVAAYYIIAPCEASGNLARYDGAHYGRRADDSAAATDDSPLVRMYRRSRTEGFGAEVKRRIMLGTYALSAGYYDAYYLKALKTRRLIRRDYDEAFKEVDVLLGPATARPAFLIGEMASDPLAMYLEDLYTVTANLAGLPALSMPCGFTSQGLPIGVQLQAPAFEEERLLRAAHMYQQATDWAGRRPSFEEKK
jgi:aspartyl-tRNA(Asn)/glutamyl-tRNA(Gln) amidotransferase subunit A